MGNISQAVFNDPFTWWVSFSFSQKGVSFTRPLLWHELPLFVHPTQIINKSGWHLKIIMHTALLQLPRQRQKLGKEPLHIQHLLKE